MSIGAEDGKGIYLTQMIPECAKSDGNIIVEELDEYGAAIEGKVYYFYVNSRGNDDGWWLEDEYLIGDDVDDIFFPAGTGLLVTGIANAKWSQAGEVYTDDKATPLHIGKQMLSNPYATSIFLARDVWVDCAKSDGNVIIEMLDEYGAAIEGQVYYFYVNSRGNDDGWWVEDEDLVGEDVPDVEFTAGTGILVTGIADAEFQITSPLK